MRTSQRLLMLIVSLLALMCLTGCAPTLRENQTPVKLARSARVWVEPMSGGTPRRVTIPEGYMVVEPVAIPTTGRTGGVQ